MSTLTLVENGAYSAREAALASAYSQTTPKAVAAAVKTAWSTFTTTTKNARTHWQTARTTAWSTYRTAAAACKAPAGVSDSANSTSDLSGT
jgi:hypothetical protein